MTTSNNIKTIAMLCKRQLPVSDYRLYIYGSSSYSADFARDIDIVAVVHDCKIDRAFCRTIRTEDDQKAINLYIVGESIFIDDVSTLKYGGYYAHKFLFSFQEIWRSGVGLDAPHVYWTSELKRLLRLGLFSNDMPFNVRRCHSRVLRLRPTITRSMAHYLRNAVASRRLVEFLEAAVVRDVGRATDTIAEIQTSLLAINEEKSFYLFWKEYAQHKTGGEMNHEIIHGKMVRSLDPDDTALVLKYIHSEGV